MTPYLLLVIAVFAAYANIFRNTFVFDDFSLIVHNDFLRSWNKLPALVTSMTLKGAGETGGFYRPLQMLIYFLVVQVFGISTTAFHALNITLHAVNVMLVYRMGCRLGLRAGASFAGSLLWGMHPLLTESVAGMSGTGELLFSCFCLLGLLVLLPDFAPQKFWWASMLFILALCSKETAVVFPALVTASIFLVSKKRMCLSTYLTTWPLWLLCMTYMAWFFLVHANEYNMSDLQDMAGMQLYINNLPNRILTALATLPAYFSLIIWPTRLHGDYENIIFTTFWSWPVIAGAAIVVCAVLQILWGRARYGLAMSWGFMWFAAAQSPNTGILIPVNTIFSEHWMYLPTIGLSLGMAQTIALWLDTLKSKKVWVIAATLVGMASISLGIRTHFQNEVWYNPRTFYENIFLCGESSGRSHMNLGAFYMSLGEFEKAAEQYRMAISHPAPMMQSEWPALHFSLAVAYLGVRPDYDDMISPQEVFRRLPLSSRIPEAIDELNKALELNPEYMPANKFLAVIYAYRGDKEKAIFYNNRAENSLKK